MEGFSFSSLFGANKNTCLLPFLRLLLNFTTALKVWFKPIFLLKFISTLLLRVLTIFYYFLFFLSIVFTIIKTLYIVTFCFPSEFFIRVAIFCNGKFISLCRHGCHKSCQILYLRRVDNLCRMSVCHFSSASKLLTWIINAAGSASLIISIPSAVAFWIIPLASASPSALNRCLLCCFWLLWVSLPVFSASAVKIRISSFPSSHQYHDLFSPSVSSKWLRFSFCLHLLFHGTLYFLGVILNLPLIIFNFMDLSLHHTWSYIWIYVVLPVKVASKSNSPMIFLSVAVVILNCWHGIFHPIRT